ncbi:MAG: D-aminoacylase [Gemmatimonadetes bacterium]|nr:D-aminoacylase [Gemmatimonadota bacterium]
MNRRDFIHAGAVVGAGSLAGLTPRLVQERPDLVLRRAVVFDGSGAPGFEADVAVVADRIAQVGRVTATGREEIDLAGQALCPGFIDIHTHVELSMLVLPNVESRIRQGVTLEIAGQCGGSVGPWTEEGYQRTRESYRQRHGIEIDFRDLGGFFARLERTPVAVNWASMVGQGTIRGHVVGGEDRPATEEEIGRMRALVQQGLEQGAVGLSSGLEYTPSGFASKEELVELASELQGSGYPYASHMRNEDDELLAAVEEALHVGRLARVPVQISHLKAQGERNWWKAEAVLRLLDEARESGVDVMFDRYPYIAYSTGLTNLFPSWAKSGGTRALLSRIQGPQEGPRLERYARGKIALLGSWDAVQISSIRTEENAFAKGRRLGELASERGQDPYELVVQLLVEEGGSVGMIGFGMSEENTIRILSHPLGMVCSDGNAYAPYGPLSEGAPHPRSYGTFPRVLGYYVREKGAMPLETAIHKMTGLPASRLRIADRGVIRPGAYADLVAFDPSTVRDTATFESPHQYPVGISLVAVNGQITVREGEHTGRLAGRPVRGRGAARA